MVMDDLCGFNLFLFRHMLFCSCEKKVTLAPSTHTVRKLKTSHPRTKWQKRLRSTSD